VLADGDRRAPVSATVTVGQHVVIARAPGAIAAAQAIAIDAAAPSSSVALELDRDDDAIMFDAGVAYARDEAAATRMVEAVAHYAELDEVIVVAEGVRSGGPALLAQRCAGSPLRCTAVAEIGYSDTTAISIAARSAWEAIRAAELRYPVSALVDARAGGKLIAQRCEWCRSPWLWTGVGTVAVIGTIVTIAVLSASRPPPTVSVDGSQYVAH